MDDQQHPPKQRRPMPAPRLCIPASEVAARTEPGYPRYIRTESFALDLPRGAILAAIDDASALGDQYAKHYRVEDVDLAVFAERLVISAADEMNLHQGLIRFVSRARQGEVRIRLQHLYERRDAIHARMAEIVSVAQPRPTPPVLPSAERIADRDRLLMRLRNSACSFTPAAIAAITECRMAPAQVDRLAVLADAERELLDRLDRDADAENRGYWTRFVAAAVAARDRDVRRARWAMEAYVGRQDHASPARVAWSALEAAATTAKVGDQASDEERLRVLLAWIAADVGRTYHAMHLSLLWGSYPLRRAQVRPLLEAATTVARMQPVSEGMCLDDRADLHRDWQAGDPAVWHEVGRLLHVCGDRVPGSPDRRLVPAWARALARSTVGIAPTIIADHLAREFEGDGPSGVSVGVERRGDAYVLSSSGSPRPIRRTLSHGEDDVDFDGPSPERLRLDLPDDDGEDAAPAAPEAKATPAPVAPATASPAPAAPRRDPEPVAMVAPSTAAEAAAARSDSRVVREAHAIASRARQEIVGQERAIRMLSAMVAEAKAGRKERGVGLVAGPSGSGKTYLVDTIARIAGLSYLSLSVANFVSTGIRGPNVDDIALGLIRATNGDMEAATHGVVLLDEVDKLMSPTSEYGPSVMAQLLRICDGEPHMIGDTMDKKVFGLTKGSSFPTKDLVIVMSGAWSSQRDEAVDAAQSAVGFAVGGRTTKDAAKLSLDDLHGLPRELRGRISRYAHLDDHDERSLAAIAGRFGHEYMKSTNTWARVDADARFALVIHALSRGTGARGLRSAIVALRDWLLWHPDRVGPADAIGIAHVEAALAEADGVAA